MLICLGAANALANPRRLLRSMPPALHEVSTAVVVALSVFPQLAESVVRVPRARRLRAGDAGRGEAAGAAFARDPVLEDALDRSMLLAASMDSRGYGRSGGRSRAAPAGGALLVLGLCGISVGVYAVLDGTTPRCWPADAARGRRRRCRRHRAVGPGVRRSAYRPDRWRLAELVVALGLATAAVVVPALASTRLTWSRRCLRWPGRSLAPVAGSWSG